MRRWLGVYAVTFFVVQNQFTTTRDWPFGSALSMALMLIVTLLLWAFLQRESEPLV